jgi:hypothetical protein
VPTKTVAEHQLSLEYGEIPEAAKWMAHSSSGAHKVSRSPAAPMLLGGYEVSLNLSISRVRRADRWRACSFLPMWLCGRRGRL